MSSGELPSARLVQISDPHLLEDPLATHRTVNTSVSLAHVLSRAQTHIRNADAVVLTGDIAQDELSATYDRLRESWINEWVGPHTPVWCLPGNHDAPVLMQEALSESPFSCLGHHTLGNWEVILLDSRYPGHASGLLGDDELARLADRLRHTGAEHLLVVLHHHAIALGHSWLDKVGLLDHHAFNTLLHQDGRTRAVVFGHIHQAVDRVFSTVRYLGCPSTGVQFEPNQTDFRLDTRPPGYRIMSLMPSGKIETQVVWLRQTANALTRQFSEQLESSTS
ncbi:MAG: metallophosphoesterase [Pseudomonadota bacterium]